MNPLSRRLARIETALMPAPDRPVVMLAAPPTWANEAMREQYREELVAARGKQAVIIIVAADGQDVYEPGCKVVRSYMEGCFEVFGATPSSQGRTNALADVLANLSGNVIQPVSERRCSKEQDDEHRTRPAA